MKNRVSLTPEQRAWAYRGLNALMDEARENALEHGFHEGYDALMATVPPEQKKELTRTIRLAKLALIASEVGEAVSALQHGDEQAFTEEVADIVIRVLSLCGDEHIDIGLTVLDKMTLNRSRPYKHGKEC